jgi:hypothetical protein
MKNIFFLIILSVIKSSFSQVITVTWNRTKAYNFQGDNARIPEFASAGTLVFDVEGNGKKVIDLNRMESSFYEDDVYVNTLKIASYQKTSKDRIEIVLEDFDLRTGKPFPTYQVLDLKTNKSYYSWYYNGNDNITWVYIEDGGKIQIK